MVDNTNADQELEEIATIIRKDIQGTTGWHRLGKFLLKLGKFDTAQQ
ncbi:unnamed protein product, partial [Rotaria sp. Silwood2]